MLLLIIFNILYHYLIIKFKYIVHVICICMDGTMMDHLMAKLKTRSYHCNITVNTNSNTRSKFEQYLCSEHFSKCDFANPMEYRMGFASKLTRCSGTLSKSSLTGSNWYGCILAGSLGQSISFVFGARVGHFAATPQSDVVHTSRHMVMWFGRHGDAFGTTENAFISCIYDPQITVSPTSSFSASFNGNRVKNHPKPWTCPLRPLLLEL